MSPQARMHYGHPDIMNKVPNSGVFGDFPSSNNTGKEHLGAEQISTIFPTKHERYG